MTEKVEIDHMARLWAAGRSMREIAAEVGLSRNSVAGHISRNRKLFARKNKAEKALEAIEPQPAPTRRAAKKIAPAPSYEPITRPEAKAYDLGRMPHAKDLLALNPCDCRWPLTDNGPHMFCAEEVVEGSSWCAHHKRRSVGRGTDGERRAETTLKRAA